MQVQEKVWRTFSKNYDEEDRSCVFEGESSDHNVGRYDRELYISGRIEFCKFKMEFCSSEGYYCILELDLYILGEAQLEQMRATL